MSKWTKAQKHELEWWRNNDVDPRKAWQYYDMHFLPELQEEFTLGIDIGSGPVSYFYNPNVKCTLSAAIDPLIEGYYAISKFDKYRAGRVIPTGSDLFIDWTYKQDVIFMLNMLDHVEDPGRVIKKAIDILATNGKLFIFVDIDKKPDLMHPHMITVKWIQKQLGHKFDSLIFAVEKSWKFPNDVLYYCGRKR